ncbi:MAG TPA: MFS transporter [Acidimicrobiales bacterium]|nr:MFS transporter [Acidimicrobiales bacterium]
MTTQRTEKARSKPPGQPCFDCLDEAIAVDRPRLAEPREVAFWLIAYVFAATMLGTTLPTPLYVIWQSQWHFSSGVITLIFAVYAAGVLAALVFAGRASDQVGRRPVLAAALAFSALSTVVFIVAASVGWLFLGRVLSGFSAGLMTGTATAALTDMLGPAKPRRASLVATVVNTGGLGLGPLMAGLFAQYLPRPTVLVFEVYLAFLAVAALAVAWVPETVPGRQRLTIRFAGFGIPGSGRDQFFAAGVAGFAAFSLLGIFSALAPTFLGGVLHQHNHALGGAVVFMIFAISAATQVVAGHFDYRLVVSFGLALFLVVLALIVAGLSQASLGLFLAGTGVGGVAVGCVFMGSLSSANRLAPADRRGQVVSSYFVFCYLGLAVPVIAVGISSEHFGIFRSVLVCSILLALLSVFSLATFRRGGVTAPAERSTTSPQFDDNASR